MAGLPSIRDTGIFQAAITHGPGRCSNVLLFDRRDSAISHAQVRRAAAQLIASAQTPELPKNVHILVGLGVAVMAGFRADQGGPVPGPAELHPAAKLLPDAGFQLRSHDVFVQVAADTELDRTLALRLVEHCLNEVLKCVQEHQGSRQLNGIEHFGFRDGATPTIEQVDTVLAEGVADGDAQSNLGLWALFQPYTQDVRSFFANDASARTRIVGRVPALVTEADGRRETLEDIEIAPPVSSHYARMQRAPRNLLRRGFPCRTGSEPTFAFIALGAKLESFSAALALFQTDDLKEYVGDSGGAVYFCPPSAEWLEPSVPVVKPREVAAYGRRVPMVAYDMVASFESYLMALRQAGVFAGPIGNQTVRDDVRAKLFEVHRLLDPSDALDLDAKLSQIEADANAVNGPANTYVTAS